MLKSHIKQIYHQTSLYQPEYTKQLHIPQDQPLVLLVQLEVLALPQEQLLVEA